MSLNIVHSTGEAVFRNTGTVILLWVLFTAGCNPLGHQATASPPDTVEFTRAATAPLEASPPLATEPAQAVAATVNGQSILLDDFRRELDAFSPSGTAEGINNNLPADLQLAVLKRMIDQQIIEQNSRLLGIEVTDAELDVAKNALAGSTGLEEWLVLNGLSAAQFEATLKQELLAERLFNNRTQNIASTAASVRLFFLWVDSAALADTAAQRLQEIDDFTQVSQEMQGYNPNHTGGGYADWFTMGSSGVLPAEVEAMAFTLDAGQIAGPIAAANRQYFIKLEEKDNNRLLPEQVLQQLKRTSFEQWLAEQRNSADVKVYITAE